jgi:hypothetical protein
VLGGVRFHRERLVAFLPWRCVEVLQSQLAMFHEAIPVQLLKTVSPALLCRLLRLFGPAVGAYSQAISASPSTGIAALHADLNSATTILPAALHRVLTAIGDLATEAGQEEILCAAMARGETILCNVSTPVELAFLAYVAHPLVFDTAYARVASRATRHYKLFSRPNGRIDWSAATEMRIRLLRAVHAWIGLLGISAACDMRLNPLTEEVSLLVLYDRSPQTPGMSGERGPGAGLLPAHHALVTYHARFGLLCVRAELLPEQYAYRRMFGQALFGEADWFQETTVFTGDPLMERGIEALSVAGFSGVDSTVLRGVGVEYLDRVRSAVLYTATDLAVTFTSPLFQATLAHATICSMRIAMNLSGHPRPILAEIIPPNDLTMHGPIGKAEVICGFLVARGFMRVAAQDSRSQAA